MSKFDRANFTSGSNGDEVEVHAEKYIKGAATPEQLEKIGKFARREFSADEVFVFSLSLCDNAVDRDGERFPLASLQKLAELYVGKTGILDYNRKARNQSSRIFETRVETDETRITESGEPYSSLRAWAYMVRCDENDNLILEIIADGKVGFACAVTKVVCSICGADVCKNPCKHQAGERYNGVACWRELLDPTAAYEWSLVAVSSPKKIVDNGNTELRSYATSNSKRGWGCARQQREETK